MRYLLFLTLACLTVFQSAEAKPKHAVKPAKAAVTAAPSTPPGKREEGDYVVEKRTDGSTVKYKKKTSYDFEGSSIEGIYNKPSGAYISNIKDVRGKSVLKIRENFDAEVSDSSRLVK